MNKFLAIFSGSDGELSGRRILGTLLIIWGGVLLTLSNAKGFAADSTMWQIIGAVAPGAVLIVIGAFFWQLVTWQNVNDVANILDKKP